MVAAPKLNSDAIHIGCSTEMFALCGLFFAFIICDSAVPMFVLCQTFHFAFNVFYLDSLCMLFLKNKNAKLIYLLKTRSN